MKSGKLRFRVFVDAYTDAQDSAGQPIKAWRPFAERKASIEAIDPIRSPSFRADERFEPEIFRIGMRYVPGINKTMRVRRVDDEDAETIYEILNVAPDAKTMRREHVLTCRTGINSDG